MRNQCEDRSHFREDSLTAGPQRVETLSHAQRERLAYIDFRLYFLGEIGRPDLISRFGVAPAGATREPRSS